MTSFKFIETFLFLSLGITFALIVTLVYHFKKRMENMETKCDTMFEIVQKLANELNSIQNNSTNTYPISETNAHDINAYDNLSEDIAVSESHLELQQQEEEDSGSEDEYDSESEDESEDESVDENATLTTPNTILFDKIDVPEDDKIKIINVNDSDILEVSSPNENHLEDLDYIDEENDSTVEELNENNAVQVSKLDEEENASVDNKPSRSALKKLKIAELKYMAKQNNIDIDDNATKNIIIDLLLDQ